MSIDIRITQTRPNKEPMPLRVILGNDLLYGTFDEYWRLKSGERDEKEFVAYIPQHLARGFTVNWSEDEINCITLRALTPSTPTELRIFYETVDRIVSYWDGHLEVDGNPMHIDDFLDGYERAVAFNQDTLRKISREILDGETQDMTLFCAMCPMVIGRNEAEAFIADPFYFGRWLNEKQNTDAYYASPMFYRTDEGVIGRYAITEDTRSILPMKPYVTYGFNDPDTNEQLKCDNFGIIVYSTTREDIIGEIEYDEFISKVKDAFPKSVRAFDGNHYIIEAIALEDFDAMLDKE